MKMDGKRLEILDSTLRDGAQSEGISFSVQDKLAIIEALDAFGVHYIEAGNPESNPKDMEFFQKAKTLRLKNAKLCAFGSTKRNGRSVEEDSTVKALMNAQTEAVAIFGKSWDLHVHEILKLSLDDNLKLIFDTLEFFKKQGKEVIFDAEHFFDGYKANAAYAMQVLQAACDAGADVLCLCETNGGATPDEVRDITAVVVQSFPEIRIGIHCHNDIGCAVANSMLAVEAGVSHIQGTMIGIGERTGNADLSILVPNLQLKKGYLCCSDSLTGLTDMIHKLYELANLSVPANKPYTGKSAFAHKGGMHIDGVNKCSRSFEHIPPQNVGNKRRFLMSEVSGRTTVLSKITHIAPELTKESREVVEIIEKIKDMEHQGYQFEAADGSFELLVLNVLNKFKPHFELEMYKTIGEFPASMDAQAAYAMLGVKVDGHLELATATGNGPVNALDLALRKALGVFYPEIQTVHLTDYKVRVLTAADATAAKVRVLIESTDGEESWTTIGVSTDIIEASWIALVDSIEYVLYKKETKQWACQ